MSDCTAKVIKQVGMRASDMKRYLQWSPSVLPRTRGILSKWMASFSVHHELLNPSSRFSPSSGSPVGRLSSVAHMSAARSEVARLKV